MKKFFEWLTFAELIAVIFAIVNMFVHVDTLDDGSAGPIPYLVAWPVLISPRWLGLVSAVLAFLVAACVAQGVGAAKRAP